MSMSFDRPLTEGQSEILTDFFKDREIPVAVQDDRNILFDSFEMNREEMSKLANDLGQPVQVELHEKDEIKTMSDGTKYRATSQGWRKVTDH